MTVLEWDRVGDRLFEVGLDRGVLYLEDRSGVPWNGLVSVVENPSNTLTPRYFDGMKFYDKQTIGEFSATMKAITYPDEFMQFEGMDQLDHGMFIKQQLAKRFHLSYRTLIGNDVENTDLGYKLHILYNLLAIPSQLTYQSIGSTVQPTEFSWILSSLPEIVSGHRPTAHVIIDSRYINPYKLLDLEDILYGTDSTAAMLPTFSDMSEYLDEWIGVTITDNGDGTWTAEGSPNMIKMLNPSTFQISGADATLLGENTYEISTGVE